MKKVIQSKNYITIIAVVAVLVSFLVAVKLLSQVVTEHYDDEKIVCLDAGHGGSDCGATSTDGTRLEKDDNLALTLKVKAELEAMGVKVVLTRNDDSDVTLKERCKIANKKHCNLFVAIHRNSSETGSGFEAWIPDVEKGNEKKTAEKLLKALNDVDGLANRGVKSGYRDSSANNYYINANTNMPSILLEVSFITNVTDNESFDKNIDQYAKSIAEVIYDSV